MTSDPKISLVSYDTQLSERSFSPPTLVPFSSIESTLLKLLRKENVELIFSSQEKAFCQSTEAATSLGNTSSLPIQTAGQPPQPPLKAGEGAQVCIKTGYTRGGDKIVSKVAAGGGSEPNAGNTGAVFVFNQSNLRLNAILCDEGLLTEVRTAAACVYASRLILSKNGHSMKDITKIGIVGGGVQAVWQLRFLGAVMPNSCRQVVVKTRSRKSAQQFVDKMKGSAYPMDQEWQFEHYDETGERFKKCQLIHTLTPSRKAVIGLDDVNNNDKFLHITAVGADSPGKSELESSLIKNADALFCDSIPQSKERGEFQSPEFWDGLRELGALNESDLSEGHTFTIFDSSGLPSQDLEMASLISMHLD